MTQRRTINGHAYTFVPNQWGWGVCPAGNPINRIGRSYQVYCDADGSPRKCTCPDCVHCGNWCKHLREVDAIRRETDPIYNDQLHETAVRCGVWDGVEDESKYDGADRGLRGSWRVVRWDGGMSWAVVAQNG